MGHPDHTHRRRHGPPARRLIARVGRTRICDYGDSFQHHSMSTSLLTSVVVAAVVASIISGLFASITLIIERRAKRKELIFAKALELAKLKIDTLADFAQHTSATTFIADPAEYAEYYYGLLETLHAKGRLPKGWGEEYDRRFSQRISDQ